MKALAPKLSEINFFQKEDLSDGENSESMSSIPDTETVETPVPGVTSDQLTPNTGPVTTKLTTPPGPASLSPPAHPPPSSRTKSRPSAPHPPGPSPASLSPMTGSTKPLTSLSNLSPTPKTMITGKALRLWKFYKRWPQILLYFFIVLNMEYLLQSEKIVVVF